MNNRRLRSRSRSEIHDLILHGLPGGMPAFPLPESDLHNLTQFVLSLNASASELKPDGDIVAGQQFFFGGGQCGSCHMVAGRGNPSGPDLSNIGKQLSLSGLKQSLLNPSAQITAGYEVVDVSLPGGGVLRGFARSRGNHDLQLQTLDGEIRSLLESEYKGVKGEKDSLMPPLRATQQEERDLIAYLSQQVGVPIGPRTPIPDAHERNNPVPNARIGDWPTYHGSVDGNRHSPLDQINLKTVDQLSLQWTATIPYFGLQTTPIVVDGLMFVTGPDQVSALDARTGREIWKYSRPRTTDGVAADAAKGANRGIAILGNRLFFITDNAHLLCLHRLTGALLWDIIMPDQPGSYGGTAAPLIVGNLVIAGVAGADDGIRGFLDAYEVATGKRVWRFWTVPRPGEPGSETWQGAAIVQGGGSTWLTGSYDKQSDTLYWATGNPYPDTDGEDRKGDNLYTDCVLALNPHTGHLKWHYQFTPHDLHDWDAVQPLLLVDTTFQGRDRKLVLQANRNGFFYVLDRSDGKLLLAKSFVEKLTWASGIGLDGRPKLLPANETSQRETVTCPAVRGATNWYSTAFNPATKLFYVMAVEDCGSYRRSQNGGFGRAPDSGPARKYLRALNVQTGSVVWERPQIGPAEANYSGVLSTAGGLVFYGESGGEFAAVNAANGAELWHFETNQPWKASPITYLAGGRQYVAIASGANILAFALK